MATSTRVSITSSRMRGHDSRSHKVRSHKVRSSTNERNSSSLPSTVPEILEKPNVKELRQVRAEHYNESSDGSQRDVHKRMASDYSRRKEPGPRMSATRDSTKVVREIRESHSSEHRRRRRKPQDPEGGGDESIVYVYKSTGESTSKSATPNAPRLRRTSDTVARSRTYIDREHHDDDLRITSKSNRSYYPERQNIPLRSEERPVSRTASRRTRPYFPDRDKPHSRTEERSVSRTASRSRARGTMKR